MQTFDASIDVGDAESAEPRRVADAAAARAAAPGAGRRAAPAAAASPPPVEKLGEGVFKIGGNYTSLAVDMGDHILVVESGQNDARGTAVMAAAKQAIPGKPIRFVVNSHAHFDHAGGLGAAVAEGATILTHRNNEQVLERLLVGPADAHRRQPVEGDDPPDGRRRRRSAIATSGRARTARSSSCITCPTNTATACSWSICPPRSCCGRRMSRS